MYDIKKNILYLTFFIYVYAINFEVYIARLQPLFFFLIYVYAINFEVYISRLQPLEYFHGRPSLESLGMYVHVHTGI